MSTVSVSRKTAAIGLKVSYSKNKLDLIIFIAFTFTLFFLISNG